MSEQELVELFDRLFPTGFAGTDVAEELTITDWRQAPLARAFHPTVEQVWEESRQMHENLQRIFPPRKLATEPPVPPPTLEEIRRDHVEPLWEPEQELRELVGRCLWDVFADNHEVIGADGRVAEAGSFRAAGGFIADYLNARVAGASYDYMDFYMGTIGVARRADLTPLYRLIFRRLRAAGCDWRYHFPRLFAVDLRPLGKALAKDNDQPEWSGYSPSDAVAEEAEDQQHESELQQLRADLEKAHRESIAAARNRPPPATVRAYQEIYGAWPPGWPPPDTDETAADF